MTVSPEQVTSLLHTIAAETGGKRRRSQDELASRVACAIGATQACAIEAPTGTGKSRGATLPFAVDGLRVIVSTGTKALQWQYRENDLPVVVDRLVRAGYPRRRFVVLMGRANYPCLQACDAVLAGERQLFDVPPTSSTLRDTARWAMEAAPGLEWQHAATPVPADVRAQLSAGPDECTGKRCPFYHECHAEAARKDAAGADIVLVNHALLAVYAAYGANIIPVAEDEQIGLLIDEAHMLEKAAERVFGTEVVMRGGVGGGEFGTLPDIATALRKLHLGAGLAGSFENISGALHQTCATLLAERDAKEIAIPFADRYRLLGEDLAWLSSVVHETAAVIRRFELDRERHGEGLNGAEALAVKRITSKLERADELSKAVENAEPSVVMFAERAGRGFRLVATDIDVGPRLSRALWHTPLGERRTVVLMSATIPDGYTDRIGFPGLGVQPLPSPFDLARRQLIFVADTLPSPSKQRAEWEQQAPAVGVAIADAALQTGSVLVLCTSWRAVKQYEAAMREGLRHLPWARLFVDSDALVTADVVADFAAADRAVLISAQGAWTGIDLPGKVRAVIIPAVPMPVPGNPVNEARKGFWPSRALPHPIDRATAAAQIAQGLGRLMRCEMDWGLCAVLDPRPLRSTYAYDLRSKLPPQSLIVDDRYRDQVLDWLRSGPLT